MSDQTNQADRSGDRSGQPASEQNQPTGRPASSWYREAMTRAADRAEKRGLDRPK